MPIPSPSRVPSALASKAASRSFRESAPSRQKRLSVASGIHTWAPPVEHEVAARR